MSTRTTCLLLGSICCLASSGPACRALAGVATDGTVGPRLELAGPAYAIGAELGSRAGDNLFHSFERFSLATGESAIFSGPNEVQNVIGRVTGGTRSDIDGTLRSTIPGADLFFINPAGVVFGPNASLDVRGSFHVSTADELRFADGAVFSATDPDASSLTVAAPEAFGFLGAAPSVISVDRSTLEVPAGEALFIIGGDITIDGGNSGNQGILRAEAGTLQLSALGSRGSARLSNGEVSANQRADITVTAQASIDASGDAGGMVRIDGSRFVVDQSFMFADNFDAADSRGGVDVTADTVSVLAGSALTADTFGSGEGGKVAVTARQITLETGGSFRSDTYGAGQGGSVVVNAQQLDLLTGGFIRSVAERDSTAPAGVVDLTASRLHVNNGFIGADSRSSAETADAGLVRISADRLELINEGRVANGTIGAGDGGDIIVNAKTIAADGTAEREDFFLAGISSREPARARQWLGGLGRAAHPRGPASDPQGGAGA